jgi:tetratricopeptide (TPR) repeat protein
MGHAVCAHLELAGGRWEAALRDLAAAEKLADGSSILYRASLAASPLLQLSRPDLEKTRDHLSRWGPESGGADSGTGCWLYPHLGVLPHLREYLLAILAARLGDAEAVQGHAKALEEMAGPPDAENLKRDLVRSGEAHVAWWGNQPERVLEILRQTRMETRFDLIFASPFHSQAAERHLRAEAHRLLRQDEKALRWYRTFEGNSLFDLVYLAGSHLRSGEIHERLGQRPDALRHFASAASLWKNCEPRFLPARSEAESGLNRLKGDSRDAAPAPGPNG